MKSFDKILKSNSKVKVILLLEASSIQSKEYKLLTDGLKEKLTWLNVRVLVVNKVNLQRHIKWLQIEYMPDASV